MGPGALQDPGRGGGRPLHRPRRPRDDLLELGAGDERAAPRRRARAPPPLILAVHPGALGDVLLAIPALRAFRRRWPDDTLTVAAQPRIGTLLTALGVADRSIDFDALGLAALFTGEAGGVRGGAEEIRDWPARCAEDLRRATRVVAWVGSRDPGFVRRLTALAPGAVVAPSVATDCPVWQHLLGTVGASGESEAVRSPIVVPAALVDEARRALGEAGWDGDTRLLFVHPGAGGRGKRWSAAGFAAVLDRLSGKAARFAVVLHRGPADSEAVVALSSLLTQRVILLAEPELPLLAGVLSRATAYLGNDSGISHLAAALGVPSVVLFTADRVIWRPWAARVEPLVVSMATLNEEDVVRAARALVPRVG